MAEGTPELNRIERTALALGRLVNESESGKHAQWLFHSYFSKGWVAATVRRRTYVEGLDWLRELTPDRGVMLASNHRSFFDQYVIMLSMFTVGVPWAQRIYFPVRSNFFYERPVGLLLNYLVGAGTMYPPIFRDPAKAELNRDGLNRLAGFLGTAGTVVGVHPEGTRGKGPDPYEMLPAQPGIGRIALQSKPIIIPIWINWLSNDFVRDTISNYQDGIRQRNPVIIIIGRPIDYSALTATKPRPALYKRCSDLMRAEILELSKRERVVRAMCASGEISDDDPCWLENLARG
jgi:1-acyl-sn-glycerol-3-phosphate acyltransferase